MSPHPCTSTQSSLRAGASSRKTLVVDGEQAQRLQPGSSVTIGGISLQDAEVVSAALHNFRKRPALGFSDCLVVEIARKAGHMPLGTFDRDLASMEGAQHLK